MRARTAACTVLLALTAVLTACSGSDDAKGDPAACKAAMTAQLREGLAKGDKAPKGKRPAACNGVDDKTVQRYATEILKKELPNAIESALPTPSDTPDITPECRDWIEKELQDSSDSIDATSGEDACGYLSKDELDQAIEDVTNDLMKQGATPSS